jgi:RimJ/RimL family protein N-acetyltransferase
MVDQPSALPRAIQTKRLRLEAWEPGDAPALRSALDACDAHLRPWIPFMRAEPRSLEQTRARLMTHDAEFRAGIHHRYAIWDRERAALLGEALLIGRPEPDTREVGYWLHEAHTGRGYATEAASAMVELARGVPGITRVIFRCDPRNTASDRLPPRLGATLAETITIQEPAGPLKLHVWALALG